jgi:hypothetical protein
MVGFLRRLVFVVGIFPLVAFAHLRWVVTGKSALELIDKFLRWGEAD